MTNKCKSNKIILVRDVVYRFDAISKILQGFINYVQKTWKNYETRENKREFPENPF